MIAIRIFFFFFGLKPYGQICCSLESLEPSMALEIAVLAISTSAGLFVPSAAEEYDASEFQ